MSRPSSADADVIFTRYASDPAVTRYVGWPRHRSIADTYAFLSFSDEEWRRWPAGPYLIRTRADDRVVGGTGLSFASPEESMTGYVLARDAWGQGLATEALTAMVDLARALNVLHLRALCHPDHRASWRVLEKCGFRRDESWTQRVEFPNLVPGVSGPALCYMRAP